MPLFTRVRGREILRTSPLRSSKKFVLMLSRTAFRNAWETSILLSGGRDTAAGSRSRQGEYSRFLLAGLVARRSLGGHVRRRRHTDHLLLVRHSPGRAALQRLGLRRRHRQPVDPGAFPRLHYSGCPDRLKTSREPYRLDLLARRPLLDAHRPGRPVHCLRPCYNRRAPVPGGCRRAKPMAVGAPSGAALCIYLILLFPDGRLPSSRWRPLAYFSG